MNRKQAAFNLENTIPLVDLTNPDELIRANGAAEAAQTDRLRTEVSDYANVIAQLQDLYDKNNELVQRLQFMNISTTDNIKSLLEENNRKISDKLSEMQSWDSQAMEDRITASVSRTGDSVIAAVGDTRTAIIGSVEESRSKAEALQQKSDEFNHRENVRVYRNIQASMISELGKQTQELTDAIHALEESQTRMFEEQKAGTSGKFLQKVTFGLVIGLLILQIIEGIGLISILLTLAH